MIIAALISEREKSSQSRAIYSLALRDEKNRRFVSLKERQG